MIAHVCAADGRERRTIRTPARVWLDNSAKQLRFEIRESQGRRYLCVSLWARELDGWHQRAGGVLSGWRRLFATLTALCRSWLAVYFTKADRGG